MRSIAPSMTCGILVVVAVFALTSFAHADTYWQSGTGNWSDSVNWDNGEPISGVHAHVNNGGTAQITSPNAEQCDWLYLGYNAGESGTVEMDGGSLSLLSYGRAIVGRYGSGTLKITNGATASSYWDYIGRYAGSSGTVVVDGLDSSWTTSMYVYVGRYGSGTLEITNAGLVTTMNNGFVGTYAGSTGVATVDGAGSTWKNDANLYVGYNGSGTLNIVDGGLVRVDADLYIDNNGGNDSFVNMDTGGMLALDGNAAGSIGDFMDLIHGTDAIRYWDYSLSDWDAITNATQGVDYTLEYATTGDLAGHTVLTVVPEPATLALLSLGGLALIRRRKTKA